jgi:hypothetical protein
MPALFFLNGQNLKAVCSGAAHVRAETKYNASADCARCSPKLFKQKWSAD